MFIRPIRSTVIDFALCFLTNTILIYSLLFVTPDSTIMTISTVFVGIIAWRGGVIAGVIGCIVIFISNSVAISLPLHENVVNPSYFDNKLPGYAMGFLQCLIVAIVVGSISLLTHKLRMEIRLRESTQKALEQKIAELDAFGHTVAHNLKNPLMVINMSIAALTKEMKALGNTQMDRKLSFINDGTQQMISIIEAILLLAGIKKNEKIDTTVFPMSESIDTALARMAYTIESKGVEVKKPYEWPSVFGYAPWITEAWVNYISNAIKYGGKPALQLKPVIELGFDPPQLKPATNIEYIRFWVRDNGEGIADVTTTPLFKEFTRLHSKGEGYGLGLSIVKTVIDKFKGDVGVESETGKGSLFYFTLPTTSLPIR